MTHDVSNGKTSTFMQNVFYCFASASIILVPVISLFLRVKNICKESLLCDLFAYSAISRALFEGKNPFPDHFDVLFYDGVHWLGGTVPIVYPGQMLFFVIPGYLWGEMIQMLYFCVTIGIVFLLIGLTFVKACGYQFHDLWMPGKKQLVYALCCCCCFLSCGTKDALEIGQIPILLSFCLYYMFWCPGRGRVSFGARTFLFAFIAVAKYSLLTVFAPLLFFKGHWKICIAAFSIFLLLSIFPVFCGNNLLEIYTDYSNAVAITVQPGGINHFGTHPRGMCNLDFFRNPLINLFLKALVICAVLWLFWRERKKKYLSDTLLLFALSLTLLVSYHRIYDIIFVYPLFFIRLFDFARTKQWWLFGITVLFPLFLSLPRRLLFMLIPSWGGGIPGMDSLVYLTDSPPYSHLFPIMPIFTTVLAFWSLYLYLHVKDPYRFEIPLLRENTPGE